MCLVWLQRGGIILTYKVEDILANISVQVGGYGETLSKKGISLTDLVDLTEFLVNEVSKLKSIIIEIPETYNS